MKKHKVQVPNTITDEDYERLRERARKAGPPFLSAEATRRRFAGAAQYANRHKN